MASCSSCDLRCNQQINFTNNSYGASLPALQNQQQNNLEVSVVCGFNQSHWQLNTMAEKKGLNLKPTWHPSINMQPVARAREKRANQIKSDWSKSCKLSSYWLDYFAQVLMTNYSSTVQNNLRKSFSESVERSCSVA